MYIENKKGEKNMSEWIKVKDNRPIVIRSTDDHTEITRCWGVNIAKDLIESFEKEDKEKGWYTPNFYEIFNDRTKQIVE
jgi:hypothetical protein